MILFSSGVGMTRDFLAKHNVLSCVLPGGTDPPPPALPGLLWPPSLELVGLQGPLWMLTEVMADAALIVCMVSAVCPELASLVLLLLASTGGSSGFILHRSTLSKAVVAVVYSVCDG